MPPRAGVDLGGTKIQTVVVDAKNKVLGESRRPTPTAGGPEDVAREMAEALAEAASQAKLETGEMMSADEVARLPLVNHLEMHVDQLERMLSS